ncbi:MAG: hypothetical protein WCD76_07545, partial [Pyrinomonadaceae bacterium]
MSVSESIAKDVLEEELLALLLEEQGMAVAPTISARRREETTSFPLSFEQQRLWLLSQIEPDSSAYNVPRAFRLIG